MAKRRAPEHLAHQLALGLGVLVARERLAQVSGEQAALPHLVAGGAGPAALDDVALAVAAGRRQQRGLALLVEGDEAALAVDPDRGVLEEASSAARLIIASMIEATRLLFSTTNLGVPSAV